MKNGYYVINIFIEILKFDNVSRPLLIACKQLEKIYIFTITGFVNNGFKILWRGGGCVEKVVLPLSDVVSYILKIVNTLKVYYPYTVFTTCVTLIQQKVTEKVKDKYF